MAKEEGLPNEEKQFWHVKVWKSDKSPRERVMGKIDARVDWWMRLDAVNRHTVWMYIHQAEFAGFMSSFPAHRWIRGQPKHAKP